MELHIVIGNPLEHTTPALVIGCFEDGADELFTACDAALDGCLGRLMGSKEFTGKPNTKRLLDTLGKLPAERLVLVGLGKRAEVTAERLRQAAGTAMQALRGAKVASFTSAVHLASELPEALEAVALGALLGSYSFDQYKTKDTEGRFSFETMTLLVREDAQREAAQDVAARIDALYQGVRLARDLVTQPGNVATPGFLADTARQVAERNGLSCTVLERADLEQMGMHALVGVGKGAAEPPRLIVLEHRGASAEAQPVVLVGKGITFDSGGISIKPGAGMEAMKTDMAGSAAVIATMQVAAALKLPVNVVGIVPTAENMPDGNAFKPGDILTSFSGTTIEITNTDAEGRLVLCDALHYAKRYNPATIIDMATLTGACVVALGHEAAGLMGNDQALVDALKQAGELTGERVWPMPLWEEYGEAMKSDVADLRNAASSRDAGSITAGWFLKQFVGDTPWAHLDIAGTAWTDKAKAYIPKGATGMGVRLLIEYLQSR